MRSAVGLNVCAERRRLAVIFVGTQRSHKERLRILELGYEVEDPDFESRVG